MNWKHLTFGTAVLAALTMGTAIFQDGNRKTVKTEDMVELLEGVAERRMALQESVGTNTVTWTNIVWVADPSTNRYWVENGTTNGGLQAYVLKTGIAVCSNSFVSTGQYLRGWSTIVSNAGRIREGFYSTYTVDDPEGLLSGTYTLTEVEFDGHLARARWDGPEYLLWFKADDEDGYFWSFLDALLVVNPVTNSGGGSLGAGEWLCFGDPRAMHVTGDGELLVVTNIVGSKTNLVTPYFEYQARTVTNVANAVGPFNLVSQLNYIDQSIAAIIDRFVDTSRADGGDWVSYFSLPAHTNATSFPALSLVRAVELLGPTVGTNTVDSWGYTNAHLLVFPARGTNAAMYSNTVTYCTKEVLEARYKILQLMHTTQDSPMWWTGSNVVASGMTNTSPSWPVLDGGHEASWLTNAGECNGLDLVLAGMASNHVPMTDVTWIFPATNWTQATTNQAPISWATFHIGTELRSSGYGYFPGYFKLYSFDGSFVGYSPYSGEPPLTNITPNLWTISVGYSDYSSLLMREWNRRSRLATSTPMGSWAISNAIPEYYGISMRNTNGSIITSGSGWQRMGNMQKISTTYSPGETILYGARKGAVISGDIAPFSVVESLTGLTVIATVTNLVSTNWCETTGTGTGPDWIWVDLNNNGWHDSPGETFYFKEYHGGAHYWPQYKLPSTNKVITSWTVNAGPILLKWDFDRCPP